MRTIIERVTCDRCGQVFDFEKLTNEPLRARIESLTDWLRGIGWNIQPIIGTDLRTIDHCPICAPPH